MAKVSMCLTGDDTVVHNVCWSALGHVCLDFMGRRSLPLLSLGLSVLHCLS